MRTGQYDGVSASGNATARLVDGGDVAPVNVDLVPNYKTIFDGSQGPALQHVRRDPLRDPARPRGEPADVEHGRRQPAPTSLGRDPRSRSRRRKYKGKISVYDDPIYIADAAVYLKAHQPDLGIDNPYELGRRPVQRRRRPAQAAASERRRVLVRRR